MTYNEYWQVIEAGVKPEDLITFKYEDEGVATLEGRRLHAGEGRCRSRHGRTSWPAS